MSKSPRDDRLIVDAFANLTADITEARTKADEKRLRSIRAAALGTHLREQRSVEAISPAALLRSRKFVTESTREELRKELELLSPEELPGEVLHIARRDERETLLSGNLVDSLSGIKPSERLGPFRTLGDIDIFFDIFFVARRIELREQGVAAPAMVFSNARPPAISGTATSVEIEAGTVWIRGNLIDGSLPASSYVGIKIAGGTLKLRQTSTFNNDVIEITPPLNGTLNIELAPDEIEPVEGACLSAEASVQLPASLAFKFNGGSATVSGKEGTARAWGQEFEFANPTGNWTFIERLWTVVLEYEVSPRNFDAKPIGDDLVQFEGAGDVLTAGLGLPVVLAANPAILGEVAHAAGWFLQVDQLTAAWYDDNRRHGLERIWIGIFDSGCTIFADSITPLSPPVVHTFELWTIAGGAKRLPWRQSYPDKFAIFYNCHVVNGEHFMVSGRADVTLDRPVTTDGVPVPSPTGMGIIMLQQLNGRITALLGAVVDDKDDPIHQFALRNALVWTSAPAFIFISGPLAEKNLIDAGNAQIYFGVFAWAPTLPDPYVANAFVRLPRVPNRVAQSLLIARVLWTTPERVALTFEGELAGALAVVPGQASPGEPRPARDTKGQPEVGLTQAEQDRLTFDRQGEQAWRTAQAIELDGRGRRTEIARQQDTKSVVMIDSFLREVVGPTPNLLLLDVSTNQDLLGVAVGSGQRQDAIGVNVTSGDFPVMDLAVHSQVGSMRVVALPQVQWEPVRTLDSDQDIMTMGWFPTPLASANDGGATHIGARSQRLMPIIPEEALRGTFDAYREGTPVGIRTTFPFGLIAAIRLQPTDTPQRKADLYRLTRPSFPTEQSRGGIQVTAHAEGGRPDNGGISATFAGIARQLLNGVDLASGVPLGISVLGETLQPAGSVETVFNNDMAARPRVPVTRIDLSGYGGSNFSDWNNPFAAFAEAAKVQFQLIIGRTLLEVIKVNSVLHPWGIRVTRSITVERRPGGGVIRRDSGWQAFTPGLFDYRYFRYSH